MLNLKELEKLSQAMGCQTYTPNTLPPAEFISTRNIALDWVSGGGLVRGTPHELFGDTNLGKTTHAVTQCLNFCQMGLGARYYDVEKRLFASTVQRIFKDDPSRELFSVHKISTFEHLFTFLEAEAAAGFEGLIIIDSLATLQSQMGIDAQDKDLEASRMGGFLASPLARIAPRLKDMLADHLITAIIINQSRARTSQYQTKTNRPGGNAIQFLYSTTLELTGNNKPEKELTALDGSSLVACHVKTDKSSFAPAYRQGDYAVTSEGIDNAYSMYAFLTDPKMPQVLERQGNKWIAPQECIDKLNLPDDGLLAKKKDALYGYLADPENKAVYDWLYDHIYSTYIQVKVKLKDDSDEIQPEPEDDRREPSGVTERVFTATGGDESFPD
jgi:RecA/RadA recombinase